MLTALCKGLGKSADQSWLVAEPVMVPRQTEGGAAAAEDDGVVLTMVTDAHAKCSLLVGHLRFASAVFAALSLYQPSQMQRKLASFQPHHWQVLHGAKQVQLWSMMT